METNHPSQPGIEVKVRYTGNGREATVQADRFPYLIGRDSTSVQLALPDATVSRIHAQITCQNGVVLLENISKTNKTSVNGRTIEQPVQINSGDQAVMGSFRLTFEIQEHDSTGSCGSETVQGEEVSEIRLEQAAQEQLELGSGQAGARYCWQCGKPLQPGAAFCAECGTADDAEINGQTMFCGSCGAKVGQNFAFCWQCGKPTTPGKKRGGVSDPAVSRNSIARKRHRGPVLVVALLAVVIIIAAVVLLGGRSYEAVVKQYVDASVAGDFEKVWTLLPNQVKRGAVAYMGQSYDVEDANDIIDLLEDAYNSSTESIRDQLGEDGTYSYKIVNEQEYSMVELDNLEEELQDVAGQDIEVSSAKTVLVNLTVTGSSGEEHTHAMPIRVVKIGKSWYLAALGY